MHHIQRHFTFFGCLLLLLMAGACGVPDKAIEALVPAQDETTAKKYITLLQQKQVTPIENDLDPSLKGPSTHATLEKMAALVPAQEPLSVKVVGVNENYMAESRKINLTFEYEFPSKWLLINVATLKHGNTTTIVGINVYPLNDSLENHNRFTLAEKSPLQYAVLLFAVLIPLFSLSVLVLCIRTKGVRRKWLWIIFILVGVGYFSINWTTGLWHISPLTLSLLGAGAFAPAYGAWTISISVPLGGICFLIWRQKRRNAVEPAAKLDAN